MTPCTWLKITHPCNSTHYGWWVNFYFFTIYMYKHCFLPLDTCFNEMMFLIALLSASRPLLLFTSVTYMLASMPISTLHGSTLHSFLAHHQLCYVDVYCVCTIKQSFYILSFSLYYSRLFICCFYKYFCLDVCPAHSCFCVNLFLIISNYLA